MVLARRRRGSRTVVVNRRRRNHDRRGRRHNNNRRRSRRRNNNRRGCRSNNYRSRGDDPADEIHDTIGKCQSLIVVVMGKSAGADAGDRDCKQNFQLSIHNFSLSCFGFIFKVRKPSDHITFLFLKLF